MVIGIYYLSEVIEDAKGAGRSFADFDEALMAYEIGELSVHAPIKIRLGDLAGDPELHADLKPTLGSLLTDEPLSNGSVLGDHPRAGHSSTRALPEGFPFVDSVVIKADIRRLIETVIERYPRSAVAETLDGIKELGFNFATKAGLTIALDDVRTPADKAQILEEYEERADKVQSLFQKGVVTDEERRQELIEIWTEATEKVTDAMKGGLKSERFNALDMMVGSGARGNMMQVRQIAGMRGLVANPKGDIIPRPIISNFREGLSVLEYFISTHGARKGLADTALRTADSGYLTRRLVDVSQEMIILEADCGTDKGIVITVVDERGSKIRNLRSRIFGRALADDLKEGRTLVATVDDEKLRAGTVLGTKELHAIEEADVESVRVRSPLTCDTRGGVCQACYGLSLATGKMVETGEAVGHHGRTVDRRTGNPAHHAHLPHRRCGRRGHHPWPAPGRRALRGSHAQGEGGHLRCQRRGQPRRGLGWSAHRRGERRGRGDLSDLSLRQASRRQWRRDRGGDTADRGPARPQRGPRDPGRPRHPAIPGRPGAGGVPVARCGDPRQAHRDDRETDVAAGPGGRPERLRLPAGGSDRRPAFP